MTSFLETDRHAPRANARNGADKITFKSRASAVKPAAPWNFVTIYVAKRYRSPMPVATLLAQPKGEVRHER